MEPRRTVSVNDITVNSFEFYSGMSGASKARDYGMDIKDYKSRLN